jgi:hypothetical protein
MAFVPVRAKAYYSAKQRHALGGGFRAVTVKTKPRKSATDCDRLPKRVASALYGYSGSNIAERNSRHLDNLIKKKIFP